VQVMNGCILLVTTTLSLFAGDGPRKSFQLTPDGNWSPLAPNAVIAPVTKPADAEDIDPAISRLSDLIRAGRFEQAREDGIAWLKANPSSPNYDRGLLVVAEALRGTREYVRSFYYCDQLLDEHSDSPKFEAAMELQYSVADLYLLGAKDKLLGFRIVNRQDEAIEMLFRIQTRAPGSPVAEKALLRTADFYWANGDFDLASDAYHSYAQTFPRSPLVPQARLREAYSNLAEFRGPQFDATPVLNAKTLLNQVTADYPEMAKQEAIAEKLDLADRQLARKIYLNADFYRRTGKPGAAIVLCNRLLKQYPTAPEAADAQKLLARLEQKPS
jgi:outer membrane protein assembly factor BamD